MPTIRFFITLNGIQSLRNALDAIDLVLRTYAPRRTPSVTKNIGINNLQVTLTCCNSNKQQLLIIQQQIEQMLALEAKLVASN